MGVPKFEAAINALIPTLVFGYNVFVLRYLNLSFSESKTNVSVGNLLEMIATVLLSVGIFPAPCGPLVMAYLETNGLVVPVANVTNVDCNGEV
jgi:hypothetical protein